MGAWFLHLSCCGWAIWVSPWKCGLASWHLLLMCLVNQMQRPASTCPSIQGLLWEVPLEKPQTKGLSQKWIYLPIGPGFLIFLLYLAHRTSVLGKRYTHFRWWVFPAETTEQPPFRTWTYTQSCWPHTVLLTAPRCWLSPLRCCYGPGDGQLAGSTSLVLCSLNPAQSWLRLGLGDSIQGARYLSLLWAFWRSFGDVLCVLGRVGQREKGRAHCLEGSWGFQCNHGIMINVIM